MLTHYITTRRQNPEHHDKDFNLICYVTTGFDV